MALNLQINTDEAQAKLKALEQQVDHLASTLQNTRGEGLDALGQKIGGLKGHMDASAGAANNLVTQMKAINTAADPAVVIAKYSGFSAAFDNLARAASTASSVVGRAFEIIGIAGMRAFLQLTTGSNWGAAFTAIGNAALGSSGLVSRAFEMIGNAGIRAFNAITTGANWVSAFSAIGRAGATGLGVAYNATVGLIGVSMSLAKTLVGDVIGAFQGTSSVILRMSSNLLGMHGIMARVAATFAHAAFSWGLLGIVAVATVASVALLTDGFGRMGTTMMTAFDKQVGPAAKRLANTLNEIDVQEFATKMGTMAGKVMTLMADLAGEVLRSAAIIVRELTALFKLLGWSEPVDKAKAAAQELATNWRMGGVELKKLNEGLNDSSKVHAKYGDSAQTAAGKVKNLATEAAGAGRAAGESTGGFDRARGSIDAIGDHALTAAEKLRRLKEAMDAAADGNPKTSYGDSVPDPFNPGTSYGEQPGQVTETPGYGDAGGGDYGSPDPYAYGKLSGADDAPSDNPVNMSSSPVPPPDEYHRGGIVGVGWPTSSRVVDPSVFAGARRFAGGGLTSGDIPAILHEGEAVVPLEGGAIPTSGGGFPPSAIAIAQMTLFAVRDVNQSIEDLNQQSVDIGVLAHNDAERAYAVLQKIDANGPRIIDGLAAVASAVRSIPSSSGGGGSSSSSSSGGSGGGLVDASKYTPSGGYVSPGSGIGTGGAVQDLDTGSWYRVVDPHWESGGSYRQINMQWNWWKPTVSPKEHDQMLKDMGGKSPGSMALGSPNALADLNGGANVTLHPNEAVIPLPDGRAVPIDDGGLFERVDAFVNAQAQTPPADAAETGQQPPGANAESAEGPTRPRPVISMPVTIHITATDVPSFQKSQDQIFQQLAMRLRRAVNTIGDMDAVDDPTKRPVKNA